MKLFTIEYMSFHLFFMLRDDVLAVSSTLDDDRWLLISLTSIQKLNYDDNVLHSHQNHEEFKRVKFQRSKMLFFPELFQSNCSLWAFMRFTQEQMLVCGACEVDEDTVKEDGESA